MPDTVKCPTCGAQCRVETEEVGPYTATNKFTPLLPEAVDPDFLAGLIAGNLDMSELVMSIRDVIDGYLQERSDGE